MSDGPDRQDASAVPASVSYRQLQAWLSAADGAAHRQPADQPLEQLIADWTLSSQRLLAGLRQAGPAVAAGRSPRQLMALGALQAHLAMALQAGTASSGREPD